MSFKLALGQLRVNPGAKDENLRCACDSVAEAAAAGARLVLLPEALPFGWTDSSALKLADTIPTGNHCVRLRHAARQHSMYVCAGLVEREGERLFNSAVFIDPRGEVLIHHRKMYEVDIAHHMYSLGDRLSVARTPLGTIGVMICADGFAPGQAITRSLALMGADIVVSPCAWAVPADHDNEKEPYGKLWADNYGAVARDYRIWIAGCSNVGPINEGPWKGRKCIGCSMVVDPAGQPVARAPYGEDAATILYANIEIAPRPAQGTQWEDYLRGRR
jgi:predicted amidohydrolase